MRKLLVSTALVTMAMVAHAQAGMDVNLGGYTAFQAASFDNDGTGKSRGDFQSESELHITAKGTADNGLEYGSYVELQTSTSDSVNTDEANLWISGSFGKFEMGDQDGAGSVLTETAPYVGLGQIHGHYNDYLPAADRGYGNGEGPGDSNLKAIDTMDATKVTYYTPKMSGFQAGFSYAPERDNSADGEQVQLSNTTGNHKNAYEAGLAYKGEVKGVAVKLGGGYVGAEAKTGSGLEDISAWSVGGKLGYNGFSFGGGYTSNGDSGQAAGVANNDVTAWTAGATYETSVWGVGLSYAHVDLDQSATPFGATGVTGSGGEYTAWGAGVSYKVAPGLSTGVDAIKFDRNRVTGADTDGYVVVTEVRAAF